MAPTTYHYLLILHKSSKSVGGDKGNRSKPFRGKFQKFKY